MLQKNYTKKIILKKIIQLKEILQQKNMLKKKELILEVRREVVTNNRKFMISNYI